MDSRNKDGSFGAGWVIFFHNRHRGFHRPGKGRNAAKASKVAVRKQICNAVTPLLGW